MRGEMNMNLSSYGLTSGYIVSECWNTYHTVLYFHRSNRALLDRFNPLIDRLREAGLPEKWKTVEMDRVAKLAATSNRRGTLDRKSLNLKNLSVAFAVLGFGALFSVTSFVAEMSVRKCNCRQSTLEVGRPE